MFGPRVSLKDRSEVYRLGDRAAVLTQVGQGGLVASVVEQSGQRYMIEAILRSLEQELMDNSCSEYTFLTEFFNVRGDHANALFMSIFDAALEAATKFVTEFLESTYDAVGVLICIRLNHLHQRLMQQRRVPCLDPHLNEMALLLWPKYGWPAGGGPAGWPSR